MLIEQFVFHSVVCFRRCGRDASPSFVHNNSVHLLTQKERLYESKVAEDAPLIIRLVDSDTLVRIIGELSPILRIEVFNEWCYAIEVHAILSVL